MRFSMVFVYVGVDQNSLEVLVNTGVIPGRNIPTTFRPWTVNSISVSSVSHRVI